MNSVTDLIQDPTTPLTLKLPQEFLVSEPTGDSSAEICHRLRRIAARNELLSTLLETNATVSVRANAVDLKPQYGDGLLEAQAARLLAISGDNALITIGCLASVALGTAVKAVQGEAIRALCQIDQSRRVLYSVIADYISASRSLNPWWAAKYDHCQCFYAIRNFPDECVAADILSLLAEQLPSEPEPQCEGDDLEEFSGLFTQKTPAENLADLIADWESADPATKDYARTFKKQIDSEGPHKPECTELAETLELVRALLSITTNQTEFGEAVAKLVGRDRTLAVSVLSALARCMVPRLARLALGHLWEEHPELCGLLVDTYEVSLHCAPPLLPALGGSVPEYLDSVLETDAVELSADNPDNLLGTNQDTLPTPEWVVARKQSLQVVLQTNTAVGDKLFRETGHLDHDDYWESLDVIQAIQYLTVLDNKSSTILECLGFVAVGYCGQEDKPKTEALRALAKVDEATYTHCLLVSCCIDWFFFFRVQLEPVAATRELLLELFLFGGKIKWLRSNVLYELLYRFPKTGVAAARRMQQEPDQDGELDSASLERILTEVDLAHSDNELADDEWPTESRYPNVWLAMDLIQDEIEFWSFQKICDQLIEADEKFAACVLPYFIDRGTTRQKLFVCDRLLRFAPEFASLLMENRVIRQALLIEKSSV